MESVEVKDPKDEKIINKDESVTNKDGNNDLEKGKQPTNQKEPDPDKARVPTVTPDNDNGDPGPPAEDRTAQEDLTN